MRGVPWTDKVSPSILDVVIVIKASGIAMPIFRSSIAKSINKGVQTP